MLSELQFKDAVKAHVLPQTVFENPGGGTTTILALSDDTLRYRRGKSSFGVKLSDLYAAYERFANQTVGTADLKEFAPAVFDSYARPAGHNCNCTTLFLILQKIGSTEQIRGTGRRGDCFKVTIQ